MTIHAARVWNFLQFCCWYGGDLPSHTIMRQEAAQLEEEHQTCLCCVRVRANACICVSSTRRTYGCSGKSCIAFCGRNSSEHIKANGVGSAGFLELAGQAGDRHGTFGSGRGSGLMKRFLARALPAVLQLHVQLPFQKDGRASASFAVGDQVSHKTFGPGIVWQFREVLLRSEVYAY